MVDATNTQNESLHSPYDGRLIRVGAGAVDLDGIIFLPEQARGLVILAQSINTDGSNTHQHAISFARVFHASSLATLIVDLFTKEERELDQETGYFQQNTEIMQQRIIGLADWLLENPETSNLSLGYFGTGISGVAALIAAAERPDVVEAVVAAGALVELARAALPGILASTLLIAAEKDEAAVKQQQEALELLTHHKKSGIVQGASLLFTEKRTLDEVARMAVEWFERWLMPIV